MIFFANPKEQNTRYKKEIFNSITKVFNSNNYILNNQVEILEKNFAKFNGIKHCLGVANGTDALTLALISLGIGPGDEVITVSHTATATVSSIYAAGASPVLLDVDDEYYTLDPSQLKKSLTKKTKCLILVHLYGLVADVKKIKNFCKINSIYLIEDVSQAHGAVYKNKRIGTFGDIGCFSCYPTKNLGAIGDAGLIVTNSKKIYSKIKLLRQYGWNNNKIVTMKGFNSRLDEIQAAILNVKLKYLDKDNDLRRKIAAYYNKHIKNPKIIKPKIRKDTIPVFHLYVIKCDKRNKFLNYMKKHKVICGVHYEVPAHRHIGFKNTKIIGKMENTNIISKKVVSLPIYPQLSMKNVAYISNIINKY